MTTIEITPEEKNLNKRRSVADVITWSVCGIGLALLCIPIVWILYGVLSKALPIFQTKFLTTTTLGNGGGLENAIVGTLLIVACVIVVAGIAGVGAGIYIAEFAPAKIGGFLRSVIEIFSGIPSIVAGYIGYVVLAVHYHWGFSLAAAVIVLSAIVIPYIAKTTELALRRVPSAYREGAEALGMRETLILRRILVKAATPGVITGLIMAVAIAVGETAPLLYTAGWSSTLPKLQLTHSPVGYLTYAVWSFYNSPFKTANNLASAAALILIVLVVGLIIASRFVGRYFARHSPDQQS